MHRRAPFLRYYHTLHTLHPKRARACAIQAAAGLCAWVLSMVRAGKEMHVGYAARLRSCCAFARLGSVPPLASLSLFLPLRTFTPSFFL